MLPLLHFLNNTYYLYHNIYGKKFALNSIPFVSSIHTIIQTPPEINNYTYFNGQTLTHSYMPTHLVQTLSSKHKTIKPTHTRTSKYTYLPSQISSYLHYTIHIVSSKLKSITLNYVITNNQTLTPLTNSYNLNLQVFLTKIALLTLCHNFSFDFLLYKSYFNE